MGPEFELGHGLLSKIKAEKPSADEKSNSKNEIEVWLSFAKAWDDILFPQLEDRYSGRPEQLMELLRIDNPPPMGEYAWKLRSAMAGTYEARALNSVRVRDLDIEIIKNSFKWLTR